MKSCDFSRSFATFVATDRSNNARIQVEARCELLDLKTGESENYYLVASCKGEDTYGNGRLFLSPSYDFCMIYSSTDFVILRTYVCADSDNRTVGDNSGYFLDVQFHISMVNAEVLENAKDVVQATFAGRILNGRTEISDDAGRYRAILEFPVKTMNVNDINNVYQVDTGPILLPDFMSDKQRMVERFQLAFVAFNRTDETYFVIQTPTTIAAKDGAKTSHYSKIVRENAKNVVIALL